QIPTLLKQLRDRHRVTMVHTASSLSHGTNTAAHIDRVVVQAGLIDNGVATAGCHHACSGTPGRGLR
ncbi:hypothetical protein ACFV8Z_53340, partial [Streptomyces sp. NPDC059837]|uniref:hypothetical protein n=1 Tax=Streptomyces sp. NPDC059837 TaxID=3346968 RepID=UPI0036666E58